MSRNHSANQKLYQRAKELIPGGTQLLSKRPEMFAPDVWPSYYAKAKGNKIWDMEGREYLDMSIMAVGACILGYADDDVDTAVIEAVKSGSNASLNCPEEVELGEVLINLHPWFDQIRYCRSGGEAMSIAVRIARARTGRDKVLFSGYHGWCDWYLAANLSTDSALDGQLMPGLAPSGVPRGLAGTAIPFFPDNLDGLKDIVASEKQDVAAIVIEPARAIAASEEYLAEISDIAKGIGAVLIFDEITTGFRSCPGGLHCLYETKPDIAVLAKSMANGYAMAGIIGKSDVMQAAQGTFISSTNWTDRIGPTAALATIRKYVKTNAHLKINSVGAEVKRMWQEKANKHNVDIDISGIDSLPAFSFGASQAQNMYSAYVREMLQHNILGFRQFKPSLAHKLADVDDYAFAVDLVFEKIANMSEQDLDAIAPAHSGIHHQAHNNHTDQPDGQ